MKKNIFFYFLLCFALPIHGVAKARIIILPFIGGNTAEGLALSRVFIQHFQSSPLFEVQTTENPSIAAVTTTLRPSIGSENLYFFGQRAEAAYVMVASLDSSKSIHKLTFVIYDIKNKIQSPAAELSYQPGEDCAPSIKQNVRRLEEAHAGRQPFRFISAALLPKPNPEIPAAEPLEEVLNRYHSAGLLSEASMALFRRRGVNARVNQSGDTLLHIAAKNGAMDLLKSLIAAGAAPSIPNKEDWTPLHAAAYANQAKALNYLISLKISLEYRTHSNATPLHLAVINRAVSTARILVSQGADINALDIEGRASLHYAVHTPTSSILSLLIEAGASIDIQDTMGRTPLFLAATCPWGEHIEALEALLIKGASPNIPDIFKKTPLKSAIEAKKLQTARLLYQYGAEY